MCNAISLWSHNFFWSNSHNYYLLLVLAPNIIFMNDSCLNYLVLRYRYLTSILQGTDHSTPSCPFFTGKCRKVHKYRGLENLLNPTQNLSKRLKPSRSDIIFEKYYSGGICFTKIRIHVTIDLGLKAREVVQYCWQHVLYIMQMHMSWYPFSC